jgi:cobalt/nickel transport system permease protein
MWDTLSSGEGKANPHMFPQRSRERRSRSFLERTLASLVDAIGYSLAAEDLARTDGLLQNLDPRVKLVGILAWIVAAVTSRSLWVILGLFGGAVILAVLSGVSLWMIGNRVWIPVLIFTGCISLPALFITPGRAMVRLPVLRWPVSAQGMRAAAYLLGRAETGAMLAVLLALCTPWNHVLKSFRVFKVPVVIVVILGMTYRYIILLLQTARDMFESRQSRMVGRLKGMDRRHIIAASVGVLLSKSFETSEEVYGAMQSRGFRGEVQTMDSFRARSGDAVALAAFWAVAGAAFWLGR